MAGIGFALRKITQDQTFSSSFRAYAHAALATSGPWILTVLSLSGITLLAQKNNAPETLSTFRLLLVYTFFLSLILSAPVFTLTTRYLADQLYLKKTQKIPGLLLYSLALVYLLSAPFFIGIYWGIASLDPMICLASFVTGTLLITLWLMSLFVSVLEDYRLVSWSYLMGGIFAIIFCWILINPLGTAGLLFGFSGGISITLSMLLSQLLTQYNEGFEKPEGFLSYFKKFWILVLGSLLYNIANWVDKWIMWTAPEAEKGTSHLFFFDLYDSSLFLCQLTIIPGMAIFLVHVETGFFERCSKFYNDLVNKVTYDQIQQNHQNLVRYLEKVSRNIFIVQGGISGFFMIMAPQLFEFLSLNYNQMGIFRLGCLGAFFQNQTLFIMILLTYFDARKEPLIIAAVFLLTNCIFTGLSLHYGFRFYGYGYFLSCLLTFGVALRVLVALLETLPYHAFIKGNQSLYQKMKS